MAYDDIERSESGGSPVELYRFSMGESTWTFTNAAAMVTYNGDDYIPAYIDRGGFTKSGDATKSTVEFSLAAANPIALMFRSGWLDSALIITVYRMHLTDAEARVLWKGRVTGCKWVGSTAKLSADSSHTILKRYGLRRVYQVPCPHALYSPACGVNQATYAVNGVITSAGGSVLEVNSAAGYPSGYFSGGKLRYGNTVILIVSHSGSGIILVDALPNAVAGGTVVMHPGCSRDTGTCLSKFNNLDNYGGLPYLPHKNPFSGDALV